MTPSGRERGADTPIDWTVMEVFWEMYSAVVFGAKRSAHENPVVGLDGLRASSRPGDALHARAFAVTSVLLLAQLLAIAARWTGVVGWSWPAVFVPVALITVPLVGSLVLAVALEWMIISLRWSGARRAGRKT